MLTKNDISFKDEGLDIRPTLVFPAFRVLLWEYSFRLGIFHLSLSSPNVY